MANSDDSVDMKTSEIERLVQASTRRELSPKDQQRLESLLNSPAGEAWLTSEETELQALVHPEAGIDPSESEPLPPNLEKKLDKHLRLNEDQDTSSVAFWRKFSMGHLSAVAAGIILGLIGPLVLKTDRGIHVREIGYLDSTLVRTAVSDSFLEEVNQLENHFTVKPIIENAESWVEVETDEPRILIDPLSLELVLLLPSKSTSVKSPRITSRLDLNRPLIDQVQSLLDFASEI